MDIVYKPVIEALIFASDEPIKVNEVMRALKAIDGEDTEITESDVEECVSQLNEEFSVTNIPYTILKIAGGFLVSTRSEYAKYIGYLSSEKSKRRLSQAGLETLAIIAYKQPITKPEIESIRGVNCDNTITTLLEKSLIAISGRSETIGRPMLYITTDDFLKYFALNKISDLPKPREIEEIMQDEEFLEQKRRLMLSELETASENEIPAEETGADPIE
jgi:segregation and condensation protein B